MRRLYLGSLKLNRPIKPNSFQAYFYISRYTIKIFLDIVKMILAEVVLHLIPNRRAHPISGRHQQTMGTQMAPLESQDFTQINEAGFGDRWNTWPWSMKWWRGKLYVGTNRAYPCVEYFALHSNLPRLLKYPPRFDPDIKCADSPYELPLQAEIWRYTPGNRSWERAYQSPKDAQIPSRPGKAVARDLGFRDMLVFNEPDGTEALYVSGVSTRTIDGALPPPRLLRTTDGIYFESVPCDPGTVMGDLDAIGFRTLRSYKERMYVTGGRLFGWGILLESENPIRGNNHFRQVSPKGMHVFEMVPFNGFLYLGLRDLTKGYSVVKTNARGAPPYQFTQVVPYSGCRKILRTWCVSSMFVFQGNLYVGTDSPAELIRIYPDDRWDLIVGRPRRTPEGLKRPLSGMSDVFDDGLNRLIQRMEEHNGWLYLSTSNFASKFRNVPAIGPLFKSRAGFDLYATRDGVNFERISNNGFYETCNYNARTLESTSMGLFVGVINEQDGAKIYLGTRKSILKNAITH